MRLFPWILGLGLTGATVGALVALGGGRRSLRVPPELEGVPGVQALGEALEQATGAAGLTTYLTAVAAFESGGQRKAINPEGGPNAARGWYQIRPQTAKGSSAELGSDLNLLLDPYYATAAAGDLVDRLLRNRAAPEQDPDWLAIRRGWRLPTLVADVDELEPASALVRERFAATLAQLGIPEAFMYEKVDVSGRSWPGYAQALEILERAYPREGVA